jgi:hypothetical protein
MGLRVTTPPGPEEYQISDKNQALILTFEHIYHIVVYINLGSTWPK